MKVLNLEGLQYLVSKIKNSTVACAKKLSNTSAIGSATKPVYFNSSGVPVAGTYTLGAACEKGVSTSVTSGDMNLVTGDAVFSAIFTATNYEEGTWTPANDYGGSIDTSVYEFTDATYTRIGNIVILKATAKAKVQTKTAELYVFKGSFPYPVDTILNLFALNQNDSSKIGNFNAPRGKISFGNFTFAIESYGLTNADIGIIYTLL